MLEDKPMVYIADDDASVRVGLRRLMLASGFDVLVFASAGEFLATRLPEDNACIVADITMPGLDGLRFQKLLSESGSHLPVILISGGDEVRIREEAKLGDAVAFFRKPVDAQALLDTIHWALRGKSAKDAVALSAGRAG
jgi:FixJ family two-component response regulator